MTTRVCRPDTGVYVVENHRQRESLLLSTDAYFYIQILGEGSVPCLYVLPDPEQLPDQPKMDPSHKCKKLECSMIRLSCTYGGLYTHVPRVHSYIVLPYAAW